MFDPRGNLRVTPRDLLVEGLDMMPACEERGACDTVQLCCPVLQCLDEVVTERVDALWKEHAELEQFATQAVDECGTRADPAARYRRRDGMHA
ncbi:hypothetical protein OKW41_000197 [Paraburkholderia sp. UCT70]